MSALGLEDLHALGRRVAEDEERWAPHVRHDAQQRRYHLLHDDEDATVWLLCWMPGHDTGFHDHDGSWGAVTVVAGAVREDRLTVAGEPHGRVVGPGDTFDLGPADIHRVRHAGDAPAVTIHAYSPPLRAMGAYVVDPDNGVLRREVLREDQELRPLELDPA